MRLTPKDDEWNAAEWREERLSALDREGRRVASEEFYEVDRMTEWQYYIAAEIRGLWPYLTDRERGVSYNLAYALAEQQTKANLRCANTHGTPAMFH